MIAKTLHPVAGTLALATITTFWISTAVTETVGSAEAVVAVKTAIPWGFLLLVPALIAAGGSGVALSHGAKAGLARVKRNRMPTVAFNGVVVLIPAALFLAQKARAGAFDSAFYTVQALELLVGGINIVLLGLNMRDGLRMTGRLRAGKPARR
ncbi:hypothetical protein SAMN05444722_3561 [Rhodovulum sp. ES.010]|uniref:hypothetical protein n=1 Tax=Rhodovulum sp. ES.010 TaxID=1882821 RepID=UPI0009279B49|nr:hypothetical protein [Rhodovulum sp. ES.010]SIO56063.1 hypothetical protein SAMN05444722_3561 [Rhodovulum sp. ES.010]